MRDIEPCRVTQVFPDGNSSAGVRIIEKDGMTIVTKDTSEITTLEALDILSEARPNTNYEICGCGVVPVFMEKL